MVFYLLTPVALGGYSYINLCLPLPATDGVLPGFAAKASEWLIVHFRDEKQIPGTFSPRKRGAQWLGMTSCTE